MRAKQDLLVSPKTDPYIIFKALMVKIKGP